MNKCTHGNAALTGPVMGVALAAKDGVYSKTPSSHFSLRWPAKAVMMPLIIVAGPARQRFFEGQGLGGAGIRQGSRNGRAASGS
jgi:hypothetical protein